MIFPVSGVEVNPIIPPLVAFLVSSMTAPAGVSGAFLLLPFQMSVLNFTSPTVSPTKLIYNMRLYPEPVAGAALAGTLITSVAGVAFYSLLAFTPVVENIHNSMV